jgi:hypothetical protein
MKGLLRNGFYGVIDGARILLLLFLALGVTLLITGNATLFVVFALSSATLLACNSASSFRKEASTKWIKYALTTPVRKRDIIKSRYISHAYWALLGIALPLLFVFIAIAIHGNKFFYFEVRDPVAYFCLGFGIALFMGSILYPLLYFWGTDKNELFLIMSLLGAIGLSIGIITLLNANTMPDTMTDTEFFTGMIIYLTTAIIAYILSYFLTVLIYKRKEY